MTKPRTCVFYVVVCVLPIHNAHHRSTIRFRTVAMISDNRFNTGIPLRPFDCDGYFYSALTTNFLKSIMVALTENYYEIPI
jgi:hypothetical protein